MKEDEEGFLYPYIDEDKCVNCGLCEKVCPALHRSKRAFTEKAYAVASKDNVLLKRSSSGGMFGVLAAYILQQNGVVFGCRFNEDMEAVHCAVETEEELRRFHGSKYIQSNTQNTFAECKIRLQEGRQVLYSGTPCQIAGLKQYLGKEYENLVCVEIICHGVPSPGIWRQYIKELESRKGKEIIDAAFRYQDQGWKKFRFRTEYEDGTAEVIPGQQSSFMLAFLNNLTLRPSCYDCKFRLDYSNADLMIGDFWGVGRYYQNFDEEAGVSALLTLTDKGDRIFDDICDETDYVKADISQITPANGCLYLSVFPNRNRSTIMNMYSKRYNLDSALRQYATNYNWGQRKCSFGVWGSYNLRLVSQFLINGSCQRRAFHYSNSSIVSVMSEIKKMDIEVKLENPYRRDALLADWNKRFRHNFKTITENVDYILIDLLEERFGILQSGNTYISNSDAFKDLDCKVEAESVDYASLLKAGVWDEKMKQFVELLKSRFAEEQIILAEMYLCESFYNGETYEEFEDIQRIQQINQMLMEIYELFEKYCPKAQRIIVSAESQYAMYNHRYGCYPYHLNYEACFELADQIHDIVIG